MTIKSTTATIVVLALALPFGYPAHAGTKNIDSANAHLLSMSATSDKNSAAKIGQTLTLPLDECRIEDETFNPNVSIGFPRPKDASKLARTVRVLAVPVEFADLSPSKADMARFKNMYKIANRFYRSQSYGLAGVEEVIAPRESWVRLSETSKQAGVKSKTSSYESRKTLLRELMQNLTNGLDVGDYDQVDFLLPYWSGTQYTHVEMDLRQQTPAGEINEAIIWGGSAAGDGAVYTHEIGHSWLRFEDLYLFDPRAAGYGKSVYGAAGVWDIMNSTFRENPEMFAWHRFLNGWLKENQVTCLDEVSSRTTHYLSPIARNDGRHKTVFYKVSEGKILAMESRRKIGFDNTNEQGVLVYLVNTNIPHAMGPIKTLRPIRSGGIGNEWVPGLIRKGEFIKTQGILIRNVGSDKFGELITIEPD